MSTLSKHHSFSTSASVALLPLALFIATMDLLNRAVSLATTAATALTSSLTSLTSTLTGSSSPPRPPSPPPYHGPDLLSPLPHELHALIFSFLPLRSLFACTRISPTFSLLPSHPSTDDLFRRQLFDPTRPHLCTDRPPHEPFHSYVHRVVDSEHRLIPHPTSPHLILYEIGGCDERVKGPRQFTSMRAGWAANYDPAEVYWAYERSVEAVFGQSLFLKFVCWLEVVVDVELPTPPTAECGPYRYALYFRLGVSERSNLGSPTVAVEPVDDDARYASSASRLVHNHQLRKLIGEKESVVTGVGGRVWGEEEAELRPAEVEEVGRRRPRNQAEALMGRRRLGMRRRSFEERSRVRAERVMRELRIGVVEVRYKGKAEEASRREEEADGKEEKNDQEEGKQQKPPAPFRPDSVCMRVSCRKVGPAEGAKSGVAFDCVIAERLNPHTQQFISASMRRSHT